MWISTFIALDFPYKNFPTVSDFSAVASSCSHNTSLLMYFFKAFSPFSPASISYLTESGIFYSYKYVGFIAAMCIANWLAILSNLFDYFLSDLDKWMNDPIFPMPESFDVC